MDRRALRGRSPFSGGCLAPNRLVSVARHPKIPFFCLFGPKKLLQASFGVFEEILRDMSTFARFGGGGRRLLEEQQRHKDLRRPKHEPHMLLHQLTFSLRADQMFGQEAASGLSLNSDST